LIDTDLQPLLDQFVGGVNTTIGNLNSDKASLAQQRDEAVANADALRQQLAEVTADDASLAAKLKSALDQITGYQKQIAQLALPPTVYAGEEKFPLFLVDKKIPHQWIQPGNAGNSGGPAAGVAHGNCKWQPGAGPNGSTLVSIAPANIAPKSDDFEFYDVLPYPGYDPRRMRWDGDLYCQTPADWAASQQIEFQREHFGGGWQYTGAWAINPKTGLNYWAAAGKWKVFLNASGGNVMIDLGQPTNFFAEWLMDTVGNTFSPAFIVVNGQRIDCNLGPIKALPAAATRKEHSTEIQLDGKASALPYTVVFGNHRAEWQ